MRNFPRGGIIGKTVNFIRDLLSLRISLYAANASFFIILSSFPLLILLLGLVRYTGMPIQTVLEVMDGFLPDALTGAAEHLVISTYYSSTGALVSLSALTALWSASRGIHGLLTGLNAVYGAEEDRGYFHVRWISMLYTFGFLLVLLLTLILHVFGQSLMDAMAGSSSPLLRWLTAILDLRRLLLPVVQTALFAAMFVVLPNCKNTLKESLPGALLAAFGWLIFSDLYSVYVTYFSGYASTFGSVYAVALSMLWIYCCICILFYGGVLNHRLTKMHNA